MTTQNKQLPTLRIRNQYKAVFASLYLNQNYRIERDTEGRVGFAFSSEVSFREINSLYYGNDPVCKAIRDALETNHAMGKDLKYFKQS